MAGYTKVDIENWNRKAQYHFFKNYDNPFFNITANVEVTKLIHFAKANDVSFFLAALFCSLKIANTIDVFRYRSTAHDEVLCYDVIHAGSTILYDDNTFGFCYYEYVDDLKLFCEKGAKRIATQKKQKGLDPKTNDNNLIHYSAIPWISFTGLQHARRFGGVDTIPKITFGKYFVENNNIRMPLSVEVNHSMMDGYHVGRYFEELQLLLDHF